MTLTHILVFCGIGLLAALLLKAGARRWLLLALSILALYWLQPATPIRNLDFWLPTATLALTIGAWAMTRQSPPTRNDLIAGLGTAGLVLLIAATRFTPALCCLTASRPPQFGQVLLVVAVIALVMLALSRKQIPTIFSLTIGGGILLALLVLQKSPALALDTGALLRQWTGQDPALASALDIRWLGYSYIAFRLLHTLLDRHSGRLPELALDETLTYTLFFPALTAGPIDRVQRFVNELRIGFKLDAEKLLLAGQRIVAGVFMKFVLADGLAVFALNANNAAQTQISGWMWLLTYAYTLRIFFDFAGYTSIAIGIGHLFGFTLPENFRQPYRQPNLTAFWNSWHITLAQWFRAYYFNPLTRKLRQRKWPVWAILLPGQLGTMLLIGLWHGITWNFLIWGLWHGVGLFVHNRWAEFMKGRAPWAEQRWAKIGGALLTFHYVLLGWVWFALPQPAQALHVFSTLLGGGA